MLYEFKCRATGSVVMTQPVAERLLAIIGKSPGPKGIVTVAQMGAAIAALEKAVAAEQTPSAPADDDDDTRDRPAGVTLAQRAWPLLDMLKAAAAAERDITWGA
ncbi:MAG: DUF1840 family protein [Burkholderiaceae bacterium]|nr:DUF1840 family protein [Burkholderiaceae bacterium]